MPRTPVLSSRVPPSLLTAVLLLAGCGDTTTSPEPLEVGELRVEFTGALEGQAEGHARMHYVTSSISGESQNFVLVELMDVLDVDTEFDDLVVWLVLRNPGLGVTSTLPTGDFEVVPDWSFALPLEEDEAGASVETVELRLGEGRFFQTDQRAVNGSVQVLDSQRRDLTAEFVVDFPGGSEIGDFLISGEFRAKVW